MSQIDLKSHTVFVQNFITCMQIIGTSLDINWIQDLLQNSAKQWANDSHLTLGNVPSSDDNNSWFVDFYSNIFPHVCGF
jgi:hypothetical protein